MPDDTQPIAPVTTVPAAPAKAPEPVKAPEPEPEEVPGLSPDEERQLGELLARQRRAAEARDVVRLKVELPHTEMRAPSGHVIGSDWTTVPASAEARIMNAAADAGVTITRES